MHDIYTDRKANMVKTGWTYVGLTINPNVTTHVLSDRKLHAARRRLLNNAFSEGAMKNLEKYVVACIRDWCTLISEPQTADADKKAAWGKERDMGIWSSLLTVDVLGELCFGSRFGAMKEGYSYIMDLLITSSAFQQMVSLEEAFLKICLLTVSKTHSCVCENRSPSCRSGNCFCPS